MFVQLSRLQLICSCMLQRNYTRFFRKHSHRMKSCSWDDRSLKCWIAGWSPPSLPITALDFTGSDFTESIIIIYDCKCFFFSSRGLHKRASCEYTKWRRSPTPFLQLQTHRSRFTCCICVMDAGLTFSRWDKVWCRRCSLSLFPPTRRAPKSHITKSTMCRAVCSSKSLHRCYLKKKKKNEDLQVFMRRVLPSDSDRRRINLVVQVGAFCLIFHLWLKKKKFLLCFFFLRDTASVLPEENYSV